jgi:membrane-associated phospholipid phosphatase
VALWFSDREGFKRYGIAFIITLYIGLIVAAIVPTAPPWLAAQVGDIPHVYQIVTDISGEVAPGAYEQGYSVAGANPVAAMPSLHCGVPCLMAIALWKYPRVRWVAAWYAASMSFSIVYLGEHYFVDGLAGLAAAGAAWYAAGRLLAWWKGRQPDENAPAAALSQPAA